MSNGGSNHASPTFHFAAGLTTGILSAAILQPADLLKTRVQQSHTNTLRGSLKEILRGPNAVRNLWRGTLPSIFRTGFGSALYFTTLNTLRQSAANHNLASSAVLSSSSSLPKLSNLANLGTGAVARAGAGFVLMPVTVIKVRYESNMYNYKSILDATTAIWRVEGLRGFFAGFGATAVRDAPYAGLYVVCYEQAKQRIGTMFRGTDMQSASKMTSSTSAAVNFLSGAVAAGCATAITNPFDAIKTRLQLLPHKYENMLKAASIMLKQEGVKSMFQGLGLRMGRKALSSALAWTLYEEMINKAETRWIDSSITHRI